MHRRVRQLFAVIAAAAAATLSHAQSYPAKPIRMVIPYAPGGATDTPGRILVTKLSEISRFQTFIDNRPGAGGTVGAAIVARAAPDGYTLLITSTTHVIAGAIAGVGSIQRMKAVRWGLATTIVWAWILTIPASALVGALSLLILRLFTPNI